MVASGRGERAAHVQGRGRSTTFWKRGDDAAEAGAYNDPDPAMRAGASTPPNVERKLGGPLKRTSRTVPKQKPKDREEKIISEAMRILRGRVKRPGGGRPRSDAPRCPCGLMTLARAQARGRSSEHNSTCSFYRARGRDPDGLPTDP